MNEDDQLAEAPRKARRGRVIAGIVALVVTLVAVALVWSGSRGSTLALPIEPVSAICLEHQEPTTLVDGVLPLGAVQATFCAEGTQTLSYAPPTDPLTKGVSDLIRAFNRLPLGAAKDCEARPGLTFRIVFSYPDGSARVIRGEDGCGVIGAPGQWRNPGEDVLGSLYNHYTEQWSEATQPSAPAAYCGHFTHLPFALNHQVSTGAMCVREPQNGKLLAMTALSPTEVELLYKAVGGRSEGTSIDDGTASIARMDGPQLTFIGPEGDSRVVAQVEDDQWIFLSQYGGDDDPRLIEFAWSPDPESQTLLDALLKRATR